MCCEAEESSSTRGGARKPTNVWAKTRPPRAGATCSASLSFGRRPPSYAVAQPSRRIESSDASRGFSRLAEARWLAIQLQEERTIWTAPLAAILKAAIQNAVGDVSRAFVSLEEAAELARTADMSLYAAACQHQLGLALGGPRGSELLREAYEIMSAQQNRVPARFSAMLVPTDWDLRRGRAGSRPPI